MRQEAMRPSQEDPFWDTEDSPGRGKRSSEISKVISNVSSPDKKSSKTKDFTGTEKEKEAKEGQQKAVFIDPAAMRAKIRAEATKPAYDVSVYYHEEGVWQAIATSPVFEKMTLTVIAFNAFWIAVDTDGNDAEMLLQAQPMYQIAEHFFCVYFCFEWFCRYKSFKHKMDGRKDGWFVFDSSLVLMMFLETWVMTGFLIAMGAGSGGGLGNASILRMARLLRLSRMARMARLFRAMPELLIMIKGMAAATRSVGFTLCLLFIIIYVFGIAFRQLTAETIVGKLYFSSVPHAMHTLLIDGTILDGPGSLVQELGNETIVFAIIFYLFVLLAAFTVMNMLIGVLCEVVSAVAATERESLTVSYVKQQLMKVMEEINEDGDTTISKEEFANIVDRPEACNALQEVGVDVPGLIENIDIIFAKDNEDDATEKVLTFEDFMDTVLRLRGDNYATVKDVVDLRKYITTLNNRLREEIRSHHELKTKLGSMMGGGGPPPADRRNLQPGPGDKDAMKRQTTALDRQITTDVQPLSPKWKHDGSRTSSRELEDKARGAPPPCFPTEETPPMWPVDQQAKGEDRQLWMRRARLMESLGMAEMELRRFTECLPPRELCAPASMMQDPMDTDGSPGSSQVGNLPGQLVELPSAPEDAAAAGGPVDALSAMCSRWNQPELDDMKRQLGTLQEALSGGIGSLQRVRERCYPYLPAQGARGSSANGSMAEQQTDPEDRRPGTRRAFPALKLPGEDTEFLKGGSGSGGVQVNGPAVAGGEAWALPAANNHDTRLLTK